MTAQVSITLPYCQALLLTFCNTNLHNLVDINKDCYTANMLTVESMTKLIAVLVIIGQALVVLFLLGLPWRKTALRMIYEFASEFSVVGALLVVLGAIFGSLYFSEIAKFPPCELCWYQRILIYPQLALLVLALMKKNRDVIYQVVVLSGLGFILSLYQTYLQYGGSALVPCSTTGGAVSCATKNFLEFGYITIPVMALTGFVMILVAMLLEHWRQRNEFPEDGKITV